MPIRAQFAVGLALGTVLAFASSAHAKLDLDDRGPILHAGDFNLRVSNAGILGNPFPERSFDPSFEFPKGTGQQVMRYAALWVGALDRDGRPRVSGDPLLEWRPSTAPGDTVHEAWHGQIGGRYGIDDDGDGRLDEELLNGLDDDGDSEIDEDLGIIGQQMLSADYADNRPEAISYLYPGFERHQPLGISVHQDVFAWSYPGYRGIAGLQYTITNVTNEILRDVYIGLFADLDVRPYPDLSGSPTDDVEPVEVNVAINKGVSVVEAGTSVLSLPCVVRIRQTIPMVKDRLDPSLPVVALLPLEHSIDTLAFATGRPRIPRGSFRILRLSPERSAEAGGLPRMDAERYAALAGQWEESPADFRGDQCVLISCGPFPELLPGKSLTFSAALVVGANPDSLMLQMNRVAVVQEGRDLNLVPDVTGPQRILFTTGESGLNGHDACIEPPPGKTFIADPDCPGKFPLPEPLSPVFREYVPGTCIWTDTDCDLCTGLNGRETVRRWLDPHLVPPAPSQRLTAGDKAVTIEWDNLSEILLRARQAGPAVGDFAGYNIYRLADWRNRGSLMPPQENWALIAGFGEEGRESRQSLAAITDSTLDLLRIWYEQPQYPVGRYKFVDHNVANGVDYAYAVTTVVDQVTHWPGFESVESFESPIAVLFDDKVTPQSSAKSGAPEVWVVPNPFRGTSDWDRPKVDGDAITRHVDFMGLPAVPATIHIWTVAGDLVQTLSHDGSNGDGQAAWDLVSRNGQEIASGIYVFTVESTAGRATGRFVVIR
jgi:hypothetical protein